MIETLSPVLPDEVEAAARKLLGLEILSEAL
jgi:hypothetical protein